MKSATLFFHSASWRARANLYLGLTFNILYVVFKLITGIVYGTAWFYAAAVYYFLLCALKFLLIKTDRRVSQRKDRKAVLLWSLRSYKRCGAILMLLNLSMAATVIISLKYNKSVNYSRLVLTVFALYTIFRVIFSALDIKRLQKVEDPLLSASKHLGISVTLMSIFSLSTALLDRFCFDSGPRMVIKGIVGGLVCVTEIIIALSMIIYSSRKLRAQ